MIQVTPHIAIGEDEIHIEFIRSSGPGGQNVNKVSTAAQLRFDVAASPSLPEDVKLRLRTLAGSKMTRDGVLVIDARRHRTQPQNRQDAVDRLLSLLRQAAVRPRRRVASKPTFASRQRRIESKKRRSLTKRLRSQMGE